MKITKNEIRQAILEALNETGEVPGAPTGETGDVNSAEQGIAAQVNRFILDLAAQPGLDLNSKRNIIQIVMDLLAKRLKQEPGDLDVKKDRKRMTGASAGKQSRAAAIAAQKGEPQLEHKKKKGGK